MPSREQIVHSELNKTVNHFCAELSDDIVTDMKEVLFSIADEQSDKCRKVIREADEERESKMRRLTKLVSLYHAAMTDLRKMFEGMSPKRASALRRLMKLQDDIMAIDIGP